MQRLGAGNAPATHRELYMRNVSSHSLDSEAPEADPLPEPSRVSGDIIRFYRFAHPYSHAAPCNIAALEQMLEAKSSVGQLHPSVLD